LQARNSHKGHQKAATESTNGTSKQGSQNTNKSKAVKSRVVDAIENLQPRWLGLEWLASVWNEQWMRVATGTNDRNSDNSGNAQANFGQNPGQTLGGKPATVQDNPETGASDHWQPRGQSGGAKRLISVIKRV